MTLPPHLLREDPITTVIAVVCYIHDAAYLGIAACEIADLLFGFYVEDGCFMPMECFYVGQVLGLVDV